MTRPTMRVFLPSSLPALADVLARGEVRGTPIRAYAVRPEPGASDAAEDEELEYQALLAAAGDSLRLLAADPEAPRRRVVLAADVPDRIVEPDPGESGVASVTVAGTVPLKRVVSAHVDDEAAATDIEAALADPDAADLGEHDLMWFATQELPFMV
ncbi:hypothetical protein F4561_004676 [Lipingzhangella halophila]|uniref:Uncharacterized protein n=1 Tax=Lipingzhangella halophila TaxID=1783352 RepID=A0A7W7W4I8_9ACTN|nr:hypothetical protein [Lipingzhangella halophila]MBB4933856.1 hypothetical protein [Lipingzhangella halophila]